MELVQLTPSAYQLRGGTNAGLVVQDRRAVLIDTGLDRDTAKKILRAVDELRLSLAGVVITHAHADHFGGAAFIRARAGAPVYAPALEADVVASPIWEPLYLFSGAMPPAELRHKFTLAEACVVDDLIKPGDGVVGGIPIRAIPAPGHAPNQMMIAGGEVCFAADACFAPAILAKHGIPFYVDVEQAAKTLSALPALDGAYAAFVPGHGEAVTAIGPWARENAARLEEIRLAVADSLAESADVAEIVRGTAHRLDVAISNPVIYFLTQTTVLACLTALQAAGQASLQVADNRLLWKSGR